MMTAVERVRNLCRERRISITQLEKDLGFSNGYLNPKKVSNITSDRLLLIAEYLGVSVSDILGIEKDPAVENRSEVEEELQRFRDVDRGLFQVTKDMTVQEVELLTKFALELKRSNRGY